MEKEKEKRVRRLSNQILCGEQYQELSTLLQKVGHKTEVLDYNMLDQLGKLERGQERVIDFNYLHKSSQPHQLIEGGVKTI